MTEDGAMVSLLKAVEVASKSDTHSPSQPNGNQSPQYKNNNPSNTTTTQRHLTNQNLKQNITSSHSTPNKHHQTFVPTSSTSSALHLNQISQSLPHSVSIPSPLPSTSKNSLTPLPHLTSPLPLNSTTHSNQQPNPHNSTINPSPSNTPNPKVFGHLSNNINHHLATTTPVQSNLSIKDASIQKSLMNPPKLAPIRQLSQNPTSTDVHHTVSQALPPPPPPLPPPLPSPPPLPPMALRRISEPPSTSMSVQQQLQPSPAGMVEKRKGARIFSTSEKKLLEANYAKNKFPSRLHMETLGKALGKGTEKVRTWYNNRRALDRKLGVDVHRNHIDDVNSPARFSREYAARQMEEIVILPSNVIASPIQNIPASTSQQTALQNPTASPVKTEDGKVVVTAANTCESQAYGTENKVEEPYVAVSPSAITWAPAVSPISAERRHLSMASSAHTESSSRFRTLPLRIRNARIMIGENVIYGEMPEDPTRDTGLEVKFLFGKKRFVYEWYYGEDYMQAQSTGGPYAKMEMNFSSVYHMRLCQGHAKSTITLSFSAAPNLFLQTRESMNKYKLRSQQRQYRRVEPDEFPLPVATDHHKITMRADEARRVSNLLIEDTPRFGSIFTNLYDQSLYTHVGASSQPCQTNISGASRDHDISVLGSQPVTAAQPGDRSPIGPHIKLPVAEPPTSTGIIRSNVVDSRAIEATPNGNRCTPCNERPIVRPTTATGAAANLTATPVHWQSPQTPFMSTVSRHPDGSSIPWLASAVPPSASSTPFAERISHRGTPVYSTQVRRELNFSNTQGFGRDLSTPGNTQLKRSIHEAVGEENEESDRSRPRLSTGDSKTPVRDPRFRVPDPPIPPQLPGRNGKSVDTKNIDNVAQDGIGKGDEEPDSAVLRNLPR